ncbi:adenylyl-sulfate kinase [Paenibacillus sacheonensis]|uniref:Adenylyl-sulfate kinase n=1 Tax=Paenibacillus sacheonensis TaxID=742054 RepID=A0A7X5C2B6_9BACL|nr:adenylyl-sulfate kinase [Paenibacillus sacheonensis]MBM7563589.1 adenylylsulfate kinase [Paenibacillus sacheonensis]NBC71115.1 adenylyl-sulfate kinase [Paenibacillus sacheonensis]
MQHESSNITWQHSMVTRQERRERNGHRSCALWFTGLPGSGKSTLAFALEQALHARNIASYVLDGDNIRHGLNRDLGFSNGDRTENIRRIGEVSKLFADAGLFVLSAFISPDEKDRRMVKEMFQPGDFIEIYVKCSLAECEKRDPKGLYKKARSGQISNFTGIDGKYDVPRNPDLIIDTENMTIDQSLDVLLAYLEERN